MSAFDPLKSGRSLDQYVRYLVTVEGEAALPNLISLQAAVNQKVTETADAFATGAITQKKAVQEVADYSRQLGTLERATNRLLKEQEAGRKQTQQAIADMHEAADAAEELARAELEAENATNSLTLALTAMAEHEQTAYKARGTLTQVTRQATTEIDKSAKSQQNWGLTAVFAAQGIEDMQYGFSAIVNNLPLVTMSIGQNLGIASNAVMGWTAAISIAGVAINQVIKNWDNWGLSMVFQGANIEGADNRLKELTATMEKLGKRTMLTAEEVTRLSDAASAAKDISFGRAAQDIKTEKQEEMIAAYRETGRQGGLGELKSAITQAVLEVKSRDMEEFLRMGEEAGVRKSPYHDIVTNPYIPTAIKMQFMPKIGEQENKMMEAISARMFRQIGEGDTSTLQQLERLMTSSGQYDVGKFGGVTTKKGVPLAGLTTLFGMSPERLALANEDDVAEKKFQDENELARMNRAERERQARVDAKNTKAAEKVETKAEREAREFDQNAAHTYLRNVGEYANMNRAGLEREIQDQALSGFQAGAKGPEILKRVAPLLQNRLRANEVPEGFIKDVSEEITQDVIDGLRKRLISSTPFQVAGELMGQDERKQDVGLARGAANQKKMRDDWIAGQFRRQNYGVAQVAKLTSMTNNLMSVTNNVQEAMFSAIVELRGQVEANNQKVMRMQTGVRNGLGKSRSRRGTNQIPFGGQ